MHNLPRLVQVLLCDLDIDLPPLLAGHQACFLSPTQWPISAPSAFKVIEYATSASSSKMNAFKQHRSFTQLADPSLLSANTPTGPRDPGVTSDSSIASAFEASINKSKRVSASGINESHPGDSAAEDPLSSGPGTRDESAMNSDLSCHPTLLDRMLAMQNADFQAVKSLNSQLGIRGLLCLAHRRPALASQLFTALWPQLWQGLLLGQNISGQRGIRIRRDIVSDGEVELIEEREEESDDYDDIEEEEVTDEMMVNEVREDATTAKRSEDEGTFGDTKPKINETGMSEAHGLVSLPITVNSHSGSLVSFDATNTAMAECTAMLATPMVAFDSASCDVAVKTESMEVDEPQAISEGPTLIENRVSPHLDAVGESEGRTKIRS
ncbi:unnamed protein product [Protopolystoma xenopodis]|uniref:Uncharacterized protein n=1 Tax=Protopolystoma xenopodis TaxID=117903 RepID=A0A448WJ38_9PLAT|nr:unnamed protein product [Protopolystoma xenopodis]